MGYKIKELREALKMTQEELAEKSGVSRGTISALENGVDRTTTSKTLVKLAQALNTSVDRIFLPRVFNRLNIRRGGDRFEQHSLLQRLPDTPRR